MNFQMTIMDVFSIRGRGTVVTGRVENGTVRVGDPVELAGANGTRTTTVTNIELFHKKLDKAIAGDNVGLFLQDITKDDVQRGDLLTGTTQRW